MIKTIFLLATFASTMLLAACDVTGTAPPENAYAQPDGGYSIGDPGFGSP